MTESGYVYILINTSYEGLVKIGRTQREPQDRARELSAATGVPTPFIVAFEDFFEDCPSAEAFVHGFLENKGYRLTSNKEFFECPLNHAINAVLTAKDYLSSRSQEDTTNDDERNEGVPEVDEKPPWKEPLILGSKYYFGDGDFLQDYRKALKYFRQAEKMGSGVASYFMGELYCYGDGVPQDYIKAIEHYEQAVRRGLDICHAEMAIAYMELSQFENARKCWQKFFYNDEFENNIRTKDKQEIAQRCCRLLFEVDHLDFKADQGLGERYDIPYEHIERLRTVKDQLIKYAESAEEFSKEIRLDALNQIEKRL